MQGASFGVVARVILGAVMFIMNASVVHAKSIRCNAQINMYGQVLHAKDNLPFETMQVSYQITAGIREIASGKLNANSRGGYGKSFYSLSYTESFSDRCKDIYKVRVCSKTNSYVDKCTEKSLGRDGYMVASMPKLYVYRVGECKLDDASFVTRSNSCLEQQTGLLWSARSQNPLNYANAVSYCEQMGLADGKTWVLPTKEQLANLKGKLGATSHFTFSSANWFWADEAYPGYTDRSYLVRMSDGKTSWGRNKAGYYTVCVSPE